MLTQDYLILKLVRLKPSEEWINGGTGLIVVFPKGGVGKCIYGSTAHRLTQGDVLVLGGAGGKICSAEKTEAVFSSFSLSLEHMLPLFASNEICLLQTVIDRFKGAKLYPASAP